MLHVRWDDWVLLDDDAQRDAHVAALLATPAGGRRAARARNCYMQTTQNGFVFPKVPGEGPLRITKPAGRLEMRPGRARFVGAHVEY